MQRERHATKEGVWEDVALAIVILFIVTWTFCGDESQKVTNYFRQLLQKT